MVWWFNATVKKHRAIQVQITVTDLTYSIRRCRLFTAATQIKANCESIGRKGVKRPGKFPPATGGSQVLVSSYKFFSACKGKFKKTGQFWLSSYGASFCFILQYSLPWLRLESNEQGIWSTVVSHANETFDVLCSKCNLSKSMRRVLIQKISFCAIAQFALVFLQCYPAILCFGTRHQMNLASAREGAKTIYAKVQC